MSIARKLLPFFLFLGLMAPSLASPLFPDVPDNHWAKDAVAALAAKGLVEGYPDGTFKGDRSASRWETAMIVARLLAKMEQAHATFATKAELDEVRQLAEALREELGALGVRVDNLEEETQALDSRVSELERITFYGSLTVRAGGQSFKNDGGSGSPVFNYDSNVGTAAGAGSFIRGGPLGGNQWLPPFLGFPPVLDFALGRPLTNGTTFTSLAVLGLNVDITEDLVGGVEFAAYSSQGDSVVDAFYGVPAPYLANVFTGQGAGNGVQSQNHAPFTRMVLDNFWMSHKPSRTSVVVGSFKDTNFDSIVYSAPQNPNGDQLGGDLLFSTQPGRLPNFGVQVRGEVPLDEDEATVMDWEAMYTQMGHGNVNLFGTGNYQPHAFGANVGLRFHEERGKARLNFVRAFDEPLAAGGPLQVGNTQFPLILLNWVNPNGFYFNQLGGPNNQTAGIGSTGDIRPIVSFGGLNNDGIHGTPGVPNFGGVGPQAQDTYGLSAEYTFDASWKPRIYGEWAHSDYRPNKNSSYTADGDAFRLGLEAFLLDDDLQLNVEYTSVDPTFSPYILQYPRPAGIFLVHVRTPANDALPALFTLHDTDAFTHNREGYKVSADWHFSDNGSIQVSYQDWKQKEPTVQDIRFSPGALGAGVPNTPVLGFRPGFRDDAYVGGLSPFTFAPSGGNAFGTVLESPVGKIERFKVKGAYRWPVDEGRGITLSGEFDTVTFTRDSNLRAILGGSPAGVRGESQNFVHVDQGGWVVAVDYDVTRDFAIQARFTQVDANGHRDPFGVYNNHAERTGDTRFDTLRLSQGITRLGFDWDISENVNWAMEGRHFVTRDGLSSDVVASPQVPGLNVSFPAQVGTHPFNWSGYQVNTAFSVKL